MFSMLPVCFSASFLYVRCVFFCVSREFQNPFHRAFLHSRWTIFHLPYPYSVSFSLSSVLCSVAFCYTQPLRFINSPFVSLRFSYVPPCGPGAFWNPYVFSWVPNGFALRHSRAVVICSFAFPVSFRPAFPVHNTIWSPCVSP